MKHPDHPKHTLWLLMVVLMVGFCRFFMFFWILAANPAAIFSPDSASYDQTAQALLRTGRFAVSPDQPNMPQVVRTPGYPLFIAGSYFLFGEKRYVPLIIAQIVISLGTIIITYLIALKFWNSKTAIVSTILLSVDLPSVFNSQQILTDTLFTFVLSLAGLTALYVVNKLQHITFWVLWHSTLLASAILIRPVAYYTIVPLSITFIMIWRTYFGLPWKRIAAITILLFVPWGILIGGWQLRNYLATGNAELSNVTGWNLLFCRGADIIAQRDGITIEEARQHLGLDHYTALHPETRGWSVTQLNQRWQQEGLRLIRQHPWLFLQSQMRGLLKMMFGTGHGTLLKYLGTERKEMEHAQDASNHSIKRHIQLRILKTTGLTMLFVLAEAYLILFYSGIVFSFWQLIQTGPDVASDRQKTGFGGWRSHIVVWILIVYFVVVSISVGPEAYSRFRIPMMPFLSLYAGHGVSQMIAWWRGRIWSVPPISRST